MKPANRKAWELRDKLRALAERGIDGERDAAKRKLERLEARLNFSGKSPVRQGPDLFAGTFQKSTTAEPLAPCTDMEIGMWAKWAIENRCQISCLFRDGQLWAQTTRKTAPKLTTIANTVADGFTRLWAQFSAAPGSDAKQRANFMRGLYDGMMDDERDGEALPACVAKAPKLKPKKRAVAAAPALRLHPYTVALELGKRIRFLVPLDSIQEELGDKIKAAIQA